MNVIFFGNSEYVIPIIKYLKDSFNLKLVITTEKETNEAVISYCLENKIDYLSVNSVSSPEVKDKITDINPAFAILANFRFILPKEILKIFPKGIINIHPSLLPKYRGATPGQTAILKDDKTTGVTIIELDEEIDHGKIISQKKESILTKDTAKSLYIRLFEIGAEMLKENLNDYLEDKIILKNQDEQSVNFTKTLKRNDGYIDFTNPPSLQVISQMIRAYYPWPGVWSKIKIEGKELRAKFLPDNIIQLEGKKPISFNDFINGYSEGKDILKKLNLI